MATKHLLLTIFLQRARQIFLALGCVYVVLLALGMTPFMQRQLIYMHNLKIPLFARYDMPEKYDLAPFKTRNLRIHTSDNETLGAWFIFSDPFYTAHKTDLFSLTNSSTPTSSDELVRSALRSHPTILFLHGNGGTRAHPARVRHYQAFAARLRANVFALDYRGYGDSTGAPSEAGLTLDARAAWDWLRSRGAPPECILVVGNSLGTAVAVQFVGALEAEAEAEAKAEAGAGADEQRHGKERGRERPRGVVLLAPFSNVGSLLDTYYIAGLVPMLAPLRTIPFMASFVKSFLIHRFDSLTKIVGLKAPLLIVHAENDWDIPHSHSQTLFDAFLEQHLPALPDFAAAMAGVSDEVAQRMVELSRERRALRQELVSTSDIARVGRAEVFSKDRSHGSVVFLRTWWGRHSTLGLVEGVQDYIAEMFKMG